MNMPILHYSQIEDVIKSKCNFLYSCLLNNGSKKIIIYCVDTEEIKEMIKAFDILNNFYFLNYDIQKITSNDSEKKRTKILNKKAVQFITLNLEIILLIV